jgi:hypothetical protein
MRKVLFYLAAGSGDLINFTGILLALKKIHQDYRFDFLINKKHSYVLEDNPAVRRIIYLDDYPRIPNHCTKHGHDTAVSSHFAKRYNGVYNCWGCKTTSPHTGDFIDMMSHLMREYGFNLPQQRHELNAKFFYSQYDGELVDGLVRGSKRNIVLIEAEAFSWKSPQLALMPHIITYLKRRGYIVAGNDLTGPDVIDTRRLNLKQLKLFFDRHCCGFLGISSGMSCAIYAKPNHYRGKVVAVSGIFDHWDVGIHLDARYEGTYLYFPGTYSMDDVRIMFKGE